MTYMMKLLLMLAVISMVVSGSQLDRYIKTCTDACRGNQTCINTCYQVAGR